MKFANIRGTKFVTDLRLPNCQVRQLLPDEDYQALQIALAEPA